MRDFVSDSLRVGLTPDDLVKVIREWAWSRSSISRAASTPEGLPPDIQPRGFQTDVANAKGYLTFTEAGCGSGKSLAAYMWAREWCQRFSQAGRTNFRLFFCLPTTGTTTEHFKDYALESGIDPRLMSLTHSRADIDLRAIAATAPQEDSTDTAKDIASAAEDALNAERDKIRGLSLWTTPLVVTTTDTVLGLMVNARCSIYSLPALMCGAFVFDEIHAFDDELFGHLLVFLKNFPKLPVLLMTASLPAQRFKALQRVRPDIQCIPGPPEFEELKRYCISRVSTASDVHHAIEECLAEGGKVLWVRNQVEWANETYRNCRERYPDFCVDVYHSRLRYRDRSLRHRRVIDSFGPEAAAILIATQVAEMSLDLSADLLISDIAPIPSIIQRMGRLNRRLTPHTPVAKRKIKPALLCSLPSKPQAELPYDASQLSAAQDWIAYLTERKEPLSQRDLVMAFARFSKESEFDFKRAEERACFFSGIWETRPGSTRGEGHTISVILQQDKDELRKQWPGAQPTSDWLREYEVAIPIRDEVLKWERFGFLPVAPTDAVAYDYDELTKDGTGARWVGR